MKRLVTTAAFSFLLFSVKAQEDTSARKVFRDLLSDAQNNFAQNLGRKNYKGGKYYDTKTGFRASDETISFDTSSLGHTYFSSRFEYSFSRDRETIAKLLPNLLQVIKDLSASGEYSYSISVYDKNNTVDKEDNSGKKKKGKEKEKEKIDINTLLDEKEKEVTLQLDTRSGQWAARIVNNSQGLNNQKLLYIFIYAKSWKD